MLPLSFTSDLSWHLHLLLKYYLNINIPFFICKPLMRGGIDLLGFPAGRPAVEIPDTILTGNDWQMYNNIILNGQYRCVFTIKYNY
ncbi:hypothetical protein C3B58_07090 [Lactonifactor longoviformis]|nr:hypothetical protein C3B58_07090 [Lactonifactor longoviformis]